MRLTMVPGGNGRRANRRCCCVKVFFELANPVLNVYLYQYVELLPAGALDFAHQLWRKTAMSCFAMVEVKRGFGRLAVFD